MKPRTRHSRETGCVKTPTSGHERPIRHSRESGNPGVVEGRYSGVSHPYPSWIPAFAGMTVSGFLTILVPMTKFGTLPFP